MMSKPQFVGEKVKLGELCDVCSGGTPKRSVSEYWNEGSIPWVKIGDISSKFISSTEEQITEAGLKSSSAKLLAPGTLLYSIFASIGAVGILDIPAATNQAIAGLHIKTDRIQQDYLYHFLKSQEALAKSSGRGVAQNNINLTILREMEVPVPAIGKQKAIVEQLEVIATQIEQVKTQLDQLAFLAKSRFVEMFGKAEDEHSDFPVKTLNDVCTSIVRGPFGSALKKEFFVPKRSGAYKVYEQKHAIQKQVDIGTYYISKDRFETLKRFECHPGDILMSCSGTMGKFYQLPQNCEPGVMNQALCKFTLSNSITADYFLGFMEQVIDELGAKGSGIKNVSSVKFIKAIRIPLPPVELQGRFAAFVSQVDKSRFISISRYRDILIKRMDADIHTYKVLIDRDSPNRAL